ncbi:hypothetical protein AWB83_01348 [Caballeronia ptereochthonis]|uniref:Uncharacterized protein n=2 Tax=Caballeronia ptereochthonis TaxID=1777144 RepID=A0A158A626_9BURK|nr:hypothetical protein AWB83_01348 [Caballeronia ptereochthonis]
MNAMTDQAATTFLRDVRHPLLALHRSVLAHLRARHEAEFGPVSPGEFLQIVINGSAYRWLSPFSTLIAAIDDVLDDDEATPDARIAHAKAVVDMFSAGTRDPAFAEQFLPLLQDSPEIAVANGQVAQIVRNIARA